MKSNIFIEESRIRKDRLSDRVTDQHLLEHSASFC